MTQERRLELKYVNPKKLILWKDNPRKNDRAAEQLAELIGKHGFIDPIIATRDYVVRAGNTRLKAALLRGDRRVPVIFVDFKSEEDATAYSIADNRASENAKWDEELLRDLFGSLEKVELELDRTGFTQMEIAKLKAPKRKSFAEAVKEFTAANPTATATDFFVWMEVGSQEDLELLLQKYGRPTKEKSGQRKLDWKKVRKVLL
jgi:ParB-like chromosome segregation protein Spo0J